MVKQNRTSNIELADTITFLQVQDLFRFQESVTGFKVVDNLFVQPPFIAGALKLTGVTEPAPKLHASSRGAIGNGFSGKGFNGQRWAAFSCGPPATD